MVKLGSTRAVAKYSIVYLIQKNNNVANFEAIILNCCSFNILNGAMLHQGPTTHQMFCEGQCAAREQQGCLCISNIIET